MFICFAPSSGTTQYKYKYNFYMLSTLIVPEDIAAGNVRLSLKEFRV